MKDNFLDTEVDELIWASMKLTDEPAPELNNKLKATLYKQETTMRKLPATRSLHLWYLPMVLNLATFLMLAVAALMVIGNPYLARFAAGICFYIGGVGVVITMVGVKRTNIKENITIRVQKRGVLV